ncbi:MAG: HAMP domain-containing protein [Alphaproteobacteria bacterium]|nr:HAMP domain-containing protein [Alphaproteobacteria bacterium]
MNEPRGTYIQKPLFVRLIKRFLPRTLFGRTLMIIVTPVILSQVAATYVFFDRHWQTMTHRLTYAVAGDVGLLVDMIEDKPGQAQMDRLVRLAQDKMDLSVVFKPGEPLPPERNSGQQAIKDMLAVALHDRISYGFTIDMNAAPETIAMRIGMPSGLLVVLSPERRVYTPTTAVFISWMIGSSILLSIIALVFMRNQIRPIRRLADAAEEFGKGRDVPYFKPEGAIEVRQASAALLMMRDRLRRQITQRTAMLSGVSHDLRTPLTRMKLQLELMRDSPELAELRADIAEMEAMVEAYLAFARGEEAEQVTQVDVEKLLNEIVAAARRYNPDVSLEMPQPVTLSMRRQAMKRCIGNLVNNAAHHAKQVVITVGVRTNVIDIYIDDDGPGVAPEQREEVFRPFVRLDESRNTTAGSVGLGLTIARDIARFHGGDVLLEDSALGGLRAHVRLPV